MNKTHKKQSVTKEGKYFVWSVAENGQHLAGGYGATKEDAENDMQVWVRKQAAPTSGCPAYASPSILLPWSFDAFERAPTCHSSTIVYAADSTPLFQIYGENAADIARKVVDAVNLRPD